MGIKETLREALRSRFEQAYATRYGWDMEVVHSRKVIRNNLQVPYNIDGPLAAMATFRRPVHRLVLNRSGRFGNQVVQLKNTAFVAELTGANVIQMRAPNRLFRPQLNDGYVVRRTGRPVAGGDEVIMRGSFYYVQSLNIKLKPDDHPRLINNVIRPLLLQNLMVPDDRVGPDDLVMHFRAGDIMTGVTVHGEYGQPPVSFYLKAAELSGAGRVWLVYEDDANPAIAAVQSALENNGKTVFRQSSSLEDDCRLILSARQFACSVGTFGGALAEISTRLRRLFSFHEFEFCSLSALDTTPVEVTRIEDGDGVYKKACLDGNWSAAPRQLELLLSYPLERLVVKP